MAPQKKVVVGVTAPIPKVRAGGSPQQLLILRHHPVRLFTKLLLLLLLLKFPLFYFASFQRTDNPVSGSESLSFLSHTTTFDQPLQVVLVDWNGTCLIVQDIPASLSFAWFYWLAMIWFVLFRRTCDLALTTFFLLYATLLVHMAPRHEACVCAQGLFSSVVPYANAYMLGINARWLSVISSAVLLPPAVTLGVRFCCLYCPAQKMQIHNNRRSLHGLVGVLLFDQYRDRHHYPPGRSFFVCVQ